MSIQILQEWDKVKTDFEISLKSFIQERFQTENSMGGDKELSAAIEYSLFSGGKRFRPMLSYASCRALNISFKEVVPWAIAIECIHTYSLIHDDLPCMDDDHERRGKPTVHIKFNEAVALLAGDALLTESFASLANNYKLNPNLGALILLLTESSGFKGMIAGQSNDLYVTNKNLKITFDEVLKIHKQKTGDLIKAAVVGPFYIVNQNPKLISIIKDLGLNLGLLFQLKDDFLDAENKKENNLVQMYGSDLALQTYNQIKSKVSEIIAVNKQVDLTVFLDLVEYNDKRTH